MHLVLRPISVDLLVTMGVLLVWSGLGGWWPRRLSAERGLDLLLRGSLGLAMAVVLVCGGAAISLPGRGWILLAAGAGGWVCWWLRGRRQTRQLGGWAPALVTGAVVAAVLSARAVVNPLPSGFDPSFHSLLIESARQADGVVTTWEPFEDVPLHYPFGLHQLAASICTVGGGEAVAVFHSLQVWLTAWQAMLLVALAGRWWRRPGAAWLAGAAYLGLCGYSGPWAYSAWGGLPTVLAMGLFLAVVCMYLRRLSRYTSVVTGVFLAALILVHHLASLIAALVLAVNLLCCLGRRDMQRVAWWLRAVGVQVLLAAPYLAWYVRHASDIRQTSATSFADEPRFTLLTAGEALGWGIVVAAAIAVWALRRSGNGSRRNDLLTTWFAAPAIAFIALDWAYRAWRLHQDGVSVTAFTPSRFLAQLAYPLVLVTAGGLAIWTRRLPRRAVATVVAVATVGSIAWQQRGILSPPPSWAERISVYRDVSRHVPADALVLYTWPADLDETNWRPYFSWRPALITPLPASEAVMDPRVQQKALFILGGDLSSLQPWLDRRGFALYIVAPPGVVPADPEWRPHAVIDGYTVYHYGW